MAVDRHRVCQINPYDHNSHVSKKKYIGGVHFTFRGSILKNPGSWVKNAKTKCFSIFAYNVRKRQKTFPGSFLLALKMLCVCRRGHTLVKISGLNSTKSVKSLDSPLKSGNEWKIWSLFPKDPPHSFFRESKLGVIHHKP